MPRQMLLLVVVTCILSLLVSRGAAHPGIRPYPGALSQQDRKDILHYATRIIKIALGGADEGVGPAGAKRSSGLLNTVIDMPDLDRFGRRK